MPLVWRRSAAAAGIYLSIGLGFLATVLTKRQLSNEAFGLLSTVIVSAGFFQTLLDFTAEEALVKYGFDYTTAGDWGRLRRLFRAALAGIAVSAVRLLHLLLVASQLLFELGDGAFDGGHQLGMSLVSDEVMFVLGGHQNLDRFLVLLQVGGDFDNRKSLEVVQKLFGLFPDHLLSRFTQVPVASGNLDLHKFAPWKFGMPVVAGGFRAAPRGL